MVVVGGGNVAIDVARAAVRLVHEQVDFAEQDDDAKGLQPAFDAARMALRSGAEEVDMVSLESRAQMPAWKGEVDEAEHEGIVVDNGWGPKEIVGENGIVMDSVSSPLFDRPGSATESQAHFLLMEAASLSLQ